MPISIVLRGDLVSANYSFMLSPLFILLTKGGFKAPKENIKTLIGIYILIFIICTLYQLNYQVFFERRLISFVLFMSMFTFFFINIDEEMIEAFKLSIIFSSFIYSSHSIYLYYYSGGSSVGYDLIRPIVQSQRYGFVLIFGIWLAIFYKTTTKTSLFIKIIVIAVIYNGLGLTFSRSSIAGLLSSLTALLIFSSLNIKNNLQNSFIKKILKLFLFLSISILIVIISFWFIPDFFQYFSERFFKLNIVAVRDGYFTYSGFPPYNTYVYNVFESSEGYRIFMITEVFKYLINNPLFGSGYLGVWVMFEDLAGSAHNQLLDVLFRTGIVGLSIYIYLLFKTFIYYKNNDLSIFISLIGILAIGLFHETFKLSQGSFILSFLIAHALNSEKVKLFYQNN